MIYVCGDLHGTYDIGKLYKRNFPESVSMKKSVDFLIQLGDFGLFWHEYGSREYEKNMKVMAGLANKKYNFAFIDGNHENFELLDELEEIHKWGGKVGIVRFANGKNIYHLKRGEIYTINGQKILTIGGAMSTDKSHRVEGKTWWSGELLSKENEENIFKNLQKHDFKVDFILSHTAPFSVVERILYRYGINPARLHDDPTARVLEQVYARTSFKQWHFGHFHLDRCIFEDEESREFYCHYNAKPMRIF